MIAKEKEAKQTQLVPLSLPDDFTVTEGGAAFISQTAVAVLCGVTREAICQRIKLVTGVKLNEFNQLDSNSLELITGHYAFDSQRTNTVALESYRVLAKAGAKAYIYFKAGYNALQIPTTLPDALRLAADKAEEVESLKAQAVLDAPKVQFADSVSHSADSIIVAEYAKNLSTYQKCPIGPNKLGTYLREKKYLMSGAR